LSEASTPATVHARPAAPTVPDARPVDAHDERTADRPANRSPEAQVSRAPLAPTPRRPPSETTPDNPPRLDAKRTGKLTILVTPWALVWLDGKPVDQAPIVIEDVPAGRHRLRLKNDIAKKDETTIVTVTADQTTTVQRTW
jgi:serine/threonine-protein kinase